MVQWLILLPMQGAQIQFLVGELRSHMVHSQKIKMNKITIRTIKYLLKRKREEKGAPSYGKAAEKPRGFSGQLPLLQCKLFPSQMGLNYSVPL